MVDALTNVNKLNIKILGAGSPGLRDSEVCFHLTFLYFLSCSWDPFLVSILVL